MPRLTLRTLLAYLDDTLEPEEARDLGLKIAENPEVQQLIERIKRVTRRRGLGAPPPISDEDEVSDPNTVAEYLDNRLDSESIKEFEAACLKSDALLAEVAACHQILTLVLTEPVRVPPPAYQRMYRLLPPPLANHQRKPGKAPTLTPVPPPAPDNLESEEADVALLLGLKRYDSSDTWRGQSMLLGAIAGCVILLAIAIWMALPSPPTSTARVIPGSGDLAKSSQTPTDSLPPAPDKIPETDSQSKTTTPPPPVEPGKGTSTEEKLPPPKKPEEKPDIPAEKQPATKDFTPVTPPKQAREVAGEWLRSNTPILLVTREPRPEAPWQKVDERNPTLFTNDVILALPGYKADLKLNHEVTLHLWGNVPEQYAVPFETPLEVRLRLHPPSQSFHVDLTLEAGRIYLTCQKPDTHIRLRLNGEKGEVWDCISREANTEIMVQVHKAFVPGTPLAPEGGEPPRITAVWLVTRGQSEFRAPKRFKKFTSSAGTLVSWDNISGQLSEPQPLPKGEKRYERFPLLSAEQGKPLQAALTELADGLKEPEGLRVHLESRLQAPLLPANILPTTLAIYSYAAVTEGADVEVMAGHLFDVLSDRDRPYARRAAITAVSAWLARDSQNTKIFRNVLTDKKQLPLEEADLILSLLRGYSSRQRPDAAAAAERLVKCLDHPNLVVREAALGNLIAYFDPNIINRKELSDLPLTQRGEKIYENYLANWRKWLEEFKSSLQFPPPKQ
ncbi:MAG: hypothetical protein WHU94_03930 [Thermogemmata sp.]